MVMPERSFGRTVRYRRNKLGLSQAKLAELVGRSTATIRAWERDKSRPNDPKVVSTLAAILGIDERQLFERAEVDQPMVVETSPTVEQALATLSVETAPAPESDDVDIDLDLSDVDELTPAPAPIPVPVSVEQYRLDLVAMDDGAKDDRVDAAPAVRQPRRERALVAAAAGPGYVAPPEPYVQTPVTAVSDLSYIEDDSQRQLYRVRNLATLVAAVALVVMLIWAFGEGIGALGEWWDEFFGNLRL